MKRIVDKRYGAYCAHTAVTSEICVKCPNCGGLGRVTATDHTARFQCTGCGRIETGECIAYRCHVANRCESCGRYYRTAVPEKKARNFSVLNTACPYCGHIMPGEVRKKAAELSCYSEIKNACEPFFGYELWFLAYYKNKPVWAINRDHLDYLIAYLSADLREKPAVYPMQAQADHLPAFMKTAKNREGLVKLFKKMLQTQA